MEKVSVVIPTYNREKYILRSVKSVLDQTYQNIEVLVVDDGSADDTELVLKEIEDERLRYIRLPHNMGAPVARNTGVEMATGEYIAFHDSDDTWRNNKLERQLAYWAEHPEYDMVYCQYVLHHSTGEEVLPDIGWEYLEGDLSKALLVKNTIGTPTILVSKKSFEEVGGFDTSFKRMQDWDFSIRFAQRFMIGFVREILVDAYVTGDGISSENGISPKNSTYFESRCKLVAKYKNELIRYQLFDAVVGDIFEIAENLGVLNSVKQILMYYLK